MKAINKMEFMWSLIGDEHREKTLLGEAFSTTQPFSSSKLTSKDSYLNGVAEAALKVRHIQYFLAAPNLMSEHR